MEEGGANKRWGGARGKGGCQGFQGHLLLPLFPASFLWEEHWGGPCSEKTPKSTEVVWVETCPRVSCPFLVAFSISG